MVFAPAASANVYCVDVSGGDCTDLEPAGNLQQGLNDAAANAGPDTVRVGPNTYPTTSPGGFVYSSATGPVSIVGAGQAMTTIAVQAPVVPPAMSTQFKGFDVFGSTGSSISDLTVTLPTPPDAANMNQQYRGIQVANGTITDVTVTGPPANPTNAFGILLNVGTLSNATVTLPRVGSPTNIGFANTSSTSQGPTIADSTITADTAVRYSNISTGTARVTRSTLRPKISGVSAQIGATLVDNTVIDLGSFANATGISTGFFNPAAHTMSSTADGVTIAGTGSGATGVHAFANELNVPAMPGDTASATVRNSILDQSLDVPIRREADNNGAANVTTDYSNYNPAGNVSSNGASGTGQITASNQTNLTSMFVGSGDFHLAAGSPLIDIGDPAAPPGGATDFDGDPRALDGLFDCVSLARRDIGADEFVGPGLAVCTPLDQLAPDTTIQGKRKVRTRKRKARVTFTLGATEPGSSFECSVDSKPFFPCISPFSIKLKLGKHTVTARAKDLAGNLDPQPATVGVKVKRKPAAR